MGFWRGKKILKRRAKIPARKTEMKIENTSSGLRPPSPQRGEGNTSNFIFWSFLRAVAGRWVSLVAGCGRGFGREKDF